jgi:hypothetical protein
MIEIGWNDRVQLRIARQLLPRQKRKKENFGGDLTSPIT